MCDRPSFLFCVLVQYIYCHNMPYYYVKILTQAKVREKKWYSRVLHVSFKTRLKCCRAFGYISFKKASGRNMFLLTYKVRQVDNIPHYLPNQISLPLTSLYLELLQLQPTAFCLSRGIWHEFHWKRMMQEVNNHTIMTTTAWCKIMSDVDY